MFFASDNFEFNKLSVVAPIRKLSGQDKDRLVQKPKKIQSKKYFKMSNKRGRYCEILNL